MKLNGRTKLIGIVLVLALVFASISVFNVFAASIESVYVYIDAPVAGKTPDYTAEVSRMSNCSVKDVNSDYYKNGVCWYEKTSTGISPLKPDAKFEAGKVYMFRVELEANSDPFAVSNSRIDVDAYVNGNEAYNADGYDAWEIWVDYYFPMCVEEISSVSLDGIVAPTVGKTPTFAKINTTKYESKNNEPKLSNQSNGVVWTNMSTSVNLSVSNVFKEGTKYSVSYTLYPKTGYSFALNLQATINGQKATVTHSGSYVTVTLSNLVPKSNKQDISTVDIVVTAPTAGSKPDFTKIQETGYYSDNGGNSASAYKNGINWYDKTASSTLVSGTTQTFTEGHKYTVKVVLLAEDAYKFASNVIAKVNGKTATVDRIDDGSVIVEYTFATLPVSHTHTESGWKTDGTYHWKVCTDPTCGSITTAKEKHSGGKATCTAKAKCSKCGAEYGELATHTPGAAATESKPQTCTACGYIIAPALNHTHNLTKVEAKEATCIEAGNTEYYTCSGCSDLFETANGQTKIADRDSVIIAPKGHIDSDCKSDGEYHWQECTAEGCGTILDETKMLHTDDDGDGKCDTCNYEQGVEPTTKPSEPSNSTNNGNSDDAPISFLTWVIIGAAFVVVLAAIIVVLVIVLKKKK